jgi:hypothetical protein
MAGYERNDHKPMTLNDLMGVLAQVKIKEAKTWEKMKDKPIRMSSDEEGNSFAHLWSVDIAKTGEITLWPA